MCEGNSSDQMDFLSGFPPDYYYLVRTLQHPMIPLSPTRPASVLPACPFSFFDTAGISRHPHSEGDLVPDSKPFPPRSILGPFVASAFIGSSLESGSNYSAFSDNCRSFSRILRVGARVYNTFTKIGI